MVETAGTVGERLQDVAIEGGYDHVAAGVGEETAIAGLYRGAFLGAYSHDQQFIVCVLDAVGQYLFLAEAVDAIGHQQDATTGSFHVIQQANGHVDGGHRAAAEQRHDIGAEGGHQGSDGHHIIGEGCYGVGIACIDHQCGLSFFPESQYVPQLAFGQVEA